jgi:cyclopropane fatty-acyl-phospholipid synthase-like methyltransferase
VCRPTLCRPTFGNQDARTPLCWGGNSVASDPARERGLELLAVVPGERVLVVGYGTGHSLVTLGRSVRPVGKVFGIDLSEGMEEVARERIIDEGAAERVELSLRDARQRGPDKHVGPRFFNIL